MSYLHRRKTIQESSADPIGYQIGVDCAERNHDPCRLSFRFVERRDRKRLHELVLDLPALRPTNPTLWSRPRWFANIFEGSTLKFLEVEQQLVGQECWVREALARRREYISSLVWNLDYRVESGENSIIM